MRRLRLLAVSILVSALALAVVFVFRDLPKGKDQSARTVPAASSQRVSPAVAKTTLASLPLSFFPNLGQADASVKFISAGGSHRFLLSPTQASLSFHRRAAPKADDPALDGVAPGGAAPAAVRLEWIGADSRAEPIGEGTLPPKVHYLVGNDSSRWRSNLPTYARVGFRNVWPGVDLYYYGKQGALEYDLVVAPGADPGAVRMAIHGAERIELNGQGDLVLATAQGDIRQRRPLVYQELGGRRQEVSGGFVVTDGGQVAFEVGPYDASAPLVIDPGLEFSTYLGGTFREMGTAVVDRSGCLYVAGWTVSPDFPIVPFDADGPVQPALADGWWDAFVAKFDASGALVFSTYLGGTDRDTPFGIGVDNAGSIYLAGGTLSSDFPTQAPYQANLNGEKDLFVAKLNATGSALVYSTYLGGNHIDGYPNDLTVFPIGHMTIDASGRVWVTSVSTSTDFPTTPNAHSTVNAGTGDVVVAAMSATGDAVEYGTYVGGTEPERGMGIHVDASGFVYVSGSTRSANFPTASAFDATLGGGADYYAMKLHISETSTTLVYSTYLGGTGNEVTWFTVGPTLAVDVAGNAYIRGQTPSTDFPTVNAADPTLSGDRDGFVVKLDPSGTPVYSTYLGGGVLAEGELVGIEDVALGIAADAAGNAYVTGSTRSVDFPVVEGIQTAYQGSGDAIVVKFDPLGAIVFSTYLGGSGDDAGFSITVDAAGSIYVVGRTFSLDYPTANAYQPTIGDSDGDAFVSKIDLTMATGSIAGQVVADPQSPGTPLPGVVVDAFAVGSGDLKGTDVTDLQGRYLIANLLPGDYIVTVVLPLGYSTSLAEVPVTAVANQTVAAGESFVVTSVATSGTPRSIGFWKHQVGVATGGKGSAQLDASALCEYLDLIETHFNNNALNQVVVYDPPNGATCGQKLEAAKVLLNLVGSAAMIDRARQQLMALLLNVAANHVRLNQVVSADGATASQAITYCDNLIDDPSGNHELAKNVADLINNGQEVSAGVIPLGTQNIAYAPMAGASELRVSPNPAAGLRMFTFLLDAPSNVDLAIYDVTGRRVAEVYRGVLGAGRHSVRWKGSIQGGSLRQGFYFARLQAGTKVHTVRLVQAQR